ncbi:unnamed protein product [Peniophora sp. CBMAI 1063]|nr:unnamed protein product [Peniophora sp. CBMAI 1063]
MTGQDIEIISALNVFAEVLCHPQRPDHLDVPSSSQRVVLRTTKASWTIGRGDGSLNSVDIKVADTRLSTSRVHARLEWHGDSNVAYIHDMNSTYGTWVDGRRLTAGEGVPLKDERLEIWLGVPGGGQSSCVVYVNKMRVNTFAQTYAVESVVGSGRYGNVLKCLRRDDLAAIRAVKIIKYTGYTYETLPTLSDIRDSVSIMTTVQHDPHVCDLIDTFDNPGLSMFCVFILRMKQSWDAYPLVVIVMPYYPLGNLRDALGETPICQSTSPLSSSEIFDTR